MFVLQIVAARARADQAGALETKRPSPAPAARSRFPRPRHRRCLATAETRVQALPACSRALRAGRDRKSTRLNSSHANISYAVFCLKKKNKHRFEAGWSTRLHHAQTPRNHDI